MLDLYHKLKENYKNYYQEWYILKLKKEMNKLLLNQILHNYLLLLNHHYKMKQEKMLLEINNYLNKLLDIKLD